MEQGGFFGRQFAGAVHGEHNFIGIPVAAHVHKHGQAEGDDNPRATAQHAAEKDDQGGEQGQQSHGFELAGHEKLLKETAAARSARTSVVFFIPY